MTGLRPWREGRIVGVGEAMVEFAPVGDHLFRCGFAGDTLNTCWHMAQLLAGRASVGYVTRVGVDPFSNQLVDFIAASGVDVSHIGRDPLRTVGLYVISLAAGERSFSYWRDSSAARRLADDAGALDAALDGCALIHVSGITLAIIGETGRRNLGRALQRGRENGAVVSFDPNVRLRLWPHLDEIRQATQEMWAATDIALPSFDDEALVWGDAHADAAIARIAGCGVREIVVKNGAGETALSIDGELSRLPTPEVVEVRDSTGAGDSFNAGYLSARYVGRTAREAVGFGQRLAAEIIGHPGALAPKEALAEFRDAILGR